MPPIRPGHLSSNRPGASRCFRWLHNSHAKPVSEEKLACPKEFPGAYARPSLRWRPATIETETAGFLLLFAALHVLPSDGQFPQAPSTPPSLSRETNCHDEIFQHHEICRAVRGVAAGRLYPQARSGQHGPRNSRLSPPASFLAAPRTLRSMWATPFISP